MDTEPKEVPKPERIKVDEEFDLFKFDRTTHKVGHLHGGAGDTFETSIELDTGELLILPIWIKAYKFPGHQKKEALTPFDPEVGYTIDERDFNSETRKQKLEELPDTELDVTKAPLFLHIGIGMEIEDATHPDFLDVIKRLRLELSFPPTSLPANAEEESETNTLRPGLALESRISEDFIEAGDPWFSVFYPSRVMPLPTTGITSFPGQLEGLTIHLPSNALKLSQIKARFVLANTGKTEIPNAFKKAFEKEP